MHMTYGEVKLKEPDGVEVLATLHRDGAIVGDVVAPVVRVAREED